MSTSSLNPFNRSASYDPSAFYGRRKELKKVWEILRSQRTNCAAIIGETSIGKTSLLRYITDAKAAWQDDVSKKMFIFVYLDASPYMELAVGDQASVQFWWDIYRELQGKLDSSIQLELSPPGASKGQNLVDQALEIKSRVERLIKGRGYPIIFALDNFEGIASLPLRDSAWLRSLARYTNCAYIVTSRHLLQLLYHPDTERWGGVSPLWNLFSDPVYLGLMEEDEVKEFILQKGELKGFWSEDDITFIKNIAGRHPELVRLACAHVHDCRQQSHHPLSTEEYQFLKSWIYRDAVPLCSLLWHGLADPEFMGISRMVGYQREPWKPSLHQEVLMDVAHELDNPDTMALSELERRGLIERDPKSGQWRVFAEVMRQFIRRQERVWNIAERSTFTSATIPEDIATMQTEHLDEDKLTGVQQPPGKVSQTQTATTPAFTYLEGRVYEYLQSHVGEVCDKNDIKQAIWENKLPTDSTLQKIIERIRKKIEPDPDNPRHLIAVRGQGYILRGNQLAS